MTPTLRAKVFREWQPFAKKDLCGKPTPSLEQLVPGVIKGLGFEQRLHEAQIYKHWAEIVGAEIAKHAQPVSLQKGVLKIAVDHPVWNHALLSQRNLMLQKIRSRVGERAVSKLSFSIG